MRRLVLGDVHGAYKALIQVFQASKLNYEEDQLICLGDIADGWSEVPECFDELLRIKNLVYVLGNHDEWLYEWLKYNRKESLWLNQGGQASMDAYLRIVPRDSEFFDLMTLDHINLLKNADNFYVSKDNKCFVHGGYDWHKPIKEEDFNTLLWDRHLFQVACMWDQWYEDDKPLTICKEFDEVFIGHTSTSFTHKDLKPVHVSNVWNLDQGAGWEGKLTIMDVDTKEFWQSDIVKTLYKGERGR